MFNRSPRSGMSSFFVAIAAGLACAPSVTAQVTQVIRMVSYNTQGDVSSPTPGGVVPYIALALEGIGQQNYVGDKIQRLPDVVGLQETTSNAVSVVPLVNTLNTYYGASIYNSSPYQATQSGGNTSGNGPNALIYNQQTMNLIASVGVGTPTGSGNGEFRQVVRYELQPVSLAGTGNGIFYVYVCHAKSLSSGSESTDQTEQQEEAAIIRADEATLPSTASVIYMGDWNINASTDPSMVTMTAAGQGQAIDALNPTNQPQNWAKNTAFTGVMTDSCLHLYYRDDIQFMTSNVYNGTPGSLSYIPGSAHAFGNNGSIAEGGNVNTPGTNSALNDMVGPLTPTQVLAALNGSVGSDHLPVVADYQIVTASAPGAFVLVSPTSGAVAQPTQPTLSWAAASGAASYQVSVTPSGGSTTTLSTTSTSVVVPAAVLQNCTSVSWGVVAINGTGNTSSTPASSTFTTIAPGDFNMDGSVTVQDIFDFLSAWFAMCTGQAGPPCNGRSADFNNSGSVTVQDIFDFLNAWFSGCR